MVFIRFLLGKEVRCVFQDTLQNSSQIVDYVQSYLGSEDFGIYYNGKELPHNEKIFNDAIIHVCFSLPGGKGGFGSMLRAIGAQIEKTTNREACRDLSGRRLRDINEEQRLKKWIAKESEREQEKARRRKERIERLKAKPRHNFVDFDFEKSISELPERIDDALSAGMQKVSKRPIEEEQLAKPSTSKKKCLWLVDDFSGSSDSETEGKAGSSSQNPKTSQSSELDTYSSESSSSTSYEKQETSHPIVEKDPTDNACNPTASDSEEERVKSIEKESSTDMDIKEVTRSDLKDTSKRLSSSDENQYEDSKTPLPSDDPHCISAGQLETLEIAPVIASEKIKSKPPVTKQENSNQDDELPVDLDSFNTQEELENLGLNRLKFALMTRGLKCGGSISDRAQRLWKVRGLKPHEYPSNLLAKTKK